MKRLARSECRRSLLPLFIVAVAWISAAAPAARADSIEAQTEHEEIVQNRKYRLEHEFSLGIGLLPIDSYYKAVSATGGYTWHLSDLWGVGGDFTYLFTYNSALRDELEGSFGVPTAAFAEMQWFGRLGGMFKPFYGKLTFLNDEQVHGEFYFTLHAVLARMDGGIPTASEPAGKGERFGYGGAPGVGLRGFLTRYLSARFDLSWMILTSSGEIHYPLMLSLTFSTTTRSDL